MLIAVEQLVGAAEVAEILGVSRQRVTQLTARPDFPAPVAVLAMGKVWARDDVERWAEERDRRLGRL
jgi:predicted DNA-binding transcriptional regulator AlpA